MLQKALEVAVRYIDYAPRSRAEVVRRLERAGFESDTVEAVTNELMARGWIDDAKLAVAWIEDRASRKGYGRTRLAAELVRKGISRDEAEAAAERIDPAAELATALELARTRWRPERLDNANWDQLQAEKRRVSAYLQRRGFSWDVIGQVMLALTENTQ